MCPNVHDSCYVSESSIIVGDVTLNEGCSIWPNSVLRGDQNKIVIGKGSNIQDCSVVHVDEEHDTKIGKNVTVGHGAVVHGCEIGDDTIIGMNSTVLSGAQIGRGCIIGANALVSEDKQIPDYSVAVGIPAKVVKEYDESFVQKTRVNALHYHELRDEHKNGKYEQY